MDYKLDRNISTPYYIQIKDNIKKLVEFGYWSSGTKVPTEREMAEKLQVSRNTVSMAYDELANEGLLVSYQGKGTFIAENKDRIRQQSRKDQLLNIIDGSIEEALQLGFSIDEFLAITHVRTREKLDNLTKLKLSFIECNEEQINYFVNELDFDNGVSVMPLLLSNLQSAPSDYQNKLSESDMIITTFFHLDEVKSLLPGSEEKILPIALEIQLETIVKIARYPKGSRLGLICKSKNFANKFINAVNKAGIDHLQIEFTTASDTEELMAFVSNVDYLVTSPGKKELVTSLLTDKNNITEVIFKPDQASLNLLKSSLVDLKKNIS